FGLCEADRIAAGIFRRRRGWQETQRDEIRVAGEALARAGLFQQRQPAIWQQLRTEGTEPGGLARARRPTLVHQDQRRTARARRFGRRRIGAAVTADGQCDARDQQGRQRRQSFPCHALPPKTANNFTEAAVVASSARSGTDAEDEQAMTSPIVAARSRRSPPLPLNVSHARTEVPVVPSRPVAAAVVGAVRD